MKHLTIIAVCICFFVLAPKLKSILSNTKYLCWNQVLRNKLDVLTTGLTSAKGLLT